MYHLYGLEYHKTNLARLFNIDTPAQLIFSELQSPYNLFIKDNSIFESPINWNIPKVINFPHLKKYAAAYCKNNDSYFDINPYELEQKIDQGYFQSALYDLSITQPAMYEMVCFYMKIVVINYLAKYIEGTTDKTLGLSCMDFKNHYVIQDFYELLLHQLVHKMTFIDNRLTPQLLPEYQDVVISTSFVHKAGGNDFSFYMAFHSYLVGVEIIYYRKITETLDFKGNYHGDSASIIRKCKRGYNLLSHYSHYFTDHGKAILECANKFIDTFDEEKIYGNSSTSV